MAISLLKCCFGCLMFLPPDYWCNYFCAGTNGTREKEVTVYVEAALHYSNYLWPVLGAVLLFIGIIIISLIAFVVYQKL